MSLLESTIESIMLYRLVCNAIRFKKFLIVNKNLYHLKYIEGALRK